jgi:hypothetical protein
MTGNLYIFGIKKGYEPFFKDGKRLREIARTMKELLKKNNVEVYISDQLKRDGKRPSKFTSEIFIIDQSDISYQLGLSIDFNEEGNILEGIKEMELKDMSLIAEIDEVDEDD